jgi:hypothetical protein
MSTTTIRPAVFSTTDAAVYLGTTPEALATLRHRKSGPPFLKEGRAVKYRVAALDAYLAEREAETMAEVLR